MTPDLPAFPRPDLPESHPENYPVLKIRVMRRLGLPDDGRLWLSDAINPDILRAYGGVVTADSQDEIAIAFASVSGAVAWAEGITGTGRDRAMVSFTVPPDNPYQPVSITISLKDERK